MRTRSQCGAVSHSDTSRLWPAQKCEGDAQRLPAEIEAHQAQAAELTEELAAAEAEVECLNEACRPEREALTKKQQVDDCMLEYCACLTAVHCCSLQTDALCKPTCP